MKNKIIVKINGTKSWLFENINKIGKPKGLSSRKKEITQLKLEIEKNILQDQFSCSVVSDSLLPYEPQDARPPCQSATPGVHLNPCPSGR